jgi:hypothetical protein
LIASIKPVAPTQDFSDSLQYASALTLLKSLLHIRNNRLNFHFILDGATFITHQQADSQTRTILE